MGARTNFGVPLVAGITTVVGFQSEFSERRTWCTNFSRKKNSKPRDPQTFQNNVSSFKFLEFRKRISEVSKIGKIRKKKSVSTTHNNKVSLSFGKTSMPWSA